MLDNTLPANAFIKIDFPSSMNHIPESCSTWMIKTDSLIKKSPYTTYSGFLLKGSAFYTFYCSFSVDLLANTAYGLALGSEASLVKEGVYAPIGL